MENSHAGANQGLECGLQGIWRSYAESCHVGLWTGDLASNSHVARLAIFGIQSPGSSHEECILFLQSQAARQQAISRGIKSSRSEVCCMSSKQQRLNPVANRYCAIELMVNDILNLW
jgi:hypothetical protein